MNPTIAAITYRAMLGRRRAVLLLILPALLILFALALRATGTADLETATTLLEVAALGILPLVALIAGTGVIGPEIDDGQIMYLITKPISRATVVWTKFVVAATLVAGFGVLPGLIAGLITTGTTANVAIAFTAGLLAGGITYTAIFTALAVFSRAAATIGLFYALVWENLVGTFAPAAQNLSVQQWSLSIVDALTNVSYVEASISTAQAAVLLPAVTLAALLLAARRLRSLPLVSAT